MIFPDNPTANYYPFWYQSDPCNSESSCSASWSMLPKGLPLLPAGRLN